MANILVVDDEMGIRALLQEILTDEGHSVELAENAAQARMLRERQRPDLVLLDIWMPDVDGITLLKEWNSGAQLTMPVIMMSGHATIDTAVEATRYGALEFRAATQALCLHGRPLTLPPKPLRLVAELLAQPERVFSRRELEIAVWGHEQDSSDNLRSVLHTLRRALGDDAPIQVVNVHGLGYKLVGR